MTRSVSQSVPPDGGRPPRAAGSTRAAKSSADVIARLIDPASIAIIGASARPHAVSQTIVDNLETNGYQGAIHLVGRQAGEARGRPILAGVESLPADIDLAVLAVPAGAVLTSFEELAGRVAGAVCFASGFAEVGPQGRLVQARLGDIARTSGSRLIGPNCLGFFNYVAGVHVKMAPMARQPLMPQDRGPALAVVAQSGSLAAHVVGSLMQRAVPVAYSMTTGNEADLELADFVEFFHRDEHVGVIVVYAEQIRAPRRFLGAVAAARSAGKHVVVLHPGRSAAASAVAQSHTGALSGDHDLITTVLVDTGAAVVETLEELIDVSQLLLRFPDPPTAGLASINGSGAIGVLVQDCADEVGLELPALSPAVRDELTTRLPDYLSVHNPLDLGTGLSVQPDIIPAAVRAVNEDPGIGSVLLALPYLNQAMSRSALEGFIGATGGKPAVFMVQEEDRPLWGDFIELAERHGVVLTRSPERAVRALARITGIGRAAGRRRRPVAAAARPPSGTLPAGPVPEWRAKQLLREYGITIPDGTLATSADDAVRIADQIGYPVAAKAQAAALTHKTDLGAVALGLADEQSVRAAFDRMTANVRSARPDLAMDGVLIEAMADPGLELVVGARRDPDWGPVLLVGLGGIWIETLHDVRLLPPDLASADVVTELLSLKAGGLLTGARGGPPVDLEAVAAVVAAVGDLVLADPRISEVDLNPVIVTASGPVVVDALIVSRPPAEVRTA